MQQENTETDTDVCGADTEENNVSSDASVSVLLCDVRTVIHPSILGCFHSMAHLPSTEQCKVNYV